MRERPIPSNQEKHKLARKVDNLLRRKKGDQAVRILKEQIAKAPADPYLPYLLGWTYEDLRSNKEALEMYSRAEVLVPNNGELRVVICDFLLRTGQPVKALPYAEDFVRLWPGSSEAHSTYGKALLDLGRNNEAEGVLLTAARLSDVNPDARAELARLYEESGRDHLIRPLLEGYLKSAPDVASSHAFLADFLSNDLGDFSGALPLYEKALSLYEHSNNPSWFRQYFSTDEYPNSIVGEYLEALLESGMEEAALRIAANHLTGRNFDSFLAERFERLGDVDQAIVKLRKALESDPSHHPWRNRLARLHLLNEEFSEAGEQARRSLEGASASGDNDPWLQAPLIVSLSRQGKQAEAEALRQSVAGRDRERLAVALVDLYAQLKDWDQVIKMSEELLGSNRTIVPVIERLAEALVATGQHQSAIQRYHSITQLQPNNPRLWLALAKTQIQVGDSQAAKASLDRALRASPPTGSLKREAEQLLHGLGAPD
ncbi:MAG: tetratricopeptide repeat protein [Anaerolineales bacterium]